MLIETIRKKFKEIFNEEPLLVRSPGRVNLIGEHTDYNMGFVLPAAIDKAIYFAITLRSDYKCKLFAIDMNDNIEYQLSIFQKSEKGWPNYLMGVIDQLNKAGYKTKGFNCVFGGDIPIGAGLSSSAALEAGLAYALNHLNNFGIDKLGLVKLSQKAENEFVGVKCGIMDQFINIFGEAKKVLKLDCQSLDYEHFPFVNDDLQIVLVNTMVSHSLASSEYNMRRAQCEKGVKILQKHYPEINSLRDVTLEIVKLHKDELGEIVFKRCRYVVEENERLLKACKNLEKEDYISFGLRMFGSHRGLRDDYQVSCKELNFIQEEASKHNGVIGARMMGGGFGGCTINLVRKDFVEDFRHLIERVYQKKFGKKPEVYVCRIEGGTQIIR